MAVTLVLDFKEGLLHHTGEDLQNDIVHYIDLTASNIDQDPTTHRVSQILPAVVQLQRRQNNSDEIIVESQKVCRKRYGNRIRAQPRRRCREISRGRSRSNTREGSRGRSRGRSRGHSRGHSRGRSRGHSRSHSRGKSRGNSRGHSRGRSRGNSRDRTQGRVKGNSKKNYRNHCKCQKECYLRRNSNLEENYNYSGRHEKRNSI